MFPERAEVTRIEYEGPMLAVYTKKPEILVEQGSIVAEIVGVIRKRIVIRPDPSVRLPETEAEKITRESARLTREVKDLKAEALSTSANLMFVSKQSEVYRMIREKGLGLEELKTPPYKLIIGK